MSITFRRVKEDFVCEKCGADVSGTGYTNHCPKCLFSKHVDVYPGDRAASCEGLMKPTGLYLKGGKEYIVHRCEKCGYTKNNSVAPEDNREVVIALSAHHEEK
jgi:rubrerythrin